MMYLVEKDYYGLPGLLPYEGYDEDGGVAVMRDGSFGALWRLGGWSCEARCQDELGSWAGRMAAFLRRLPEGTCCQFLLLSDGRIEDRLAEYERATRTDGLPADAARSRRRMFERMAGEGVLRSISLFFSFRSFCGVGVPSGGIFVARPDRFGEQVKKAYLSERDRFLEQARGIESELGALGLRPRRSGKEELRTCVYRALNPDRYQINHLPPATEAAPLREQVLYGPVEMDLEAGRIRLGRTLEAVLSVIDLPAETRIGMLPLDEPRTDWVVNVACPPAQEIARFLQAKKRLSFCQDRGNAEAGIAAVRGEVDSLLTDLFLGSTRVLSARIHAFPRGATEPELEDRVDRILHRLHGAGFGAIREEALSGTLFLQSLPLSFDPRNDRMLKRSRKMVDVNLAHLAPVLRPFEGTPRPDLLLVNREGEPVTVSFFDSEVAPHGIICGISGSGKSVLANNIILEALRRCARVFVLDRGRSYQKLAKQVGGEFVRIEPERPLCMNPLGGELTQERLIFGADFLSEMVTAGRGDLATRERALLAQALRLASEPRTVSRVVEVLERMQEAAARDLALSLKLFTRGGPYGAFFDGACELNPRAALTVFELEEAALGKDIASTILMAIVQRITDACLADPEREKYLIVDEAWALLKSAATARFLENAFRTYRKYRTAAVMITQQAADFDGTAGTAIRANAPNRFFLRQTPETVRAMERLLDLSPREVELLSTVTTVKGKYSEMLVITPSGAGIARLYQDPLTYWMTTSDPSDNAYLEQLRRKYEAQGHPDPLRRALAEAAWLRPNGSNE